MSLKFADIISPLSNLKLLGRNLWGILRPSSIELKDHLVEIIKRINNLKVCGGFVVITHHPSQQATSWVLLLLIYDWLRKGRKPVTLYSHMFKSDQLVRDSAKYILMHQPDNMEILLEEMLLRPGQVFIVTCSADDWARVRPQQIYEEYGLPKIPDTVIQSREENAHREITNIHLSRGLLPELGEAYRYITLLESLGLPFPYELLTRVMNMEEDELEEKVISYANGLIFFAEWEDCSELLLTTLGKSLAQQWLEKQDKIKFGKPEDFKNKLVDDYITIIGHIKTCSKTERLLVLNILQQIKRQGLITCGLDLIRSTEPYHVMNRLKEIWQQGNVEEMYLWGKLFQSYQLTDAAAEVFEEIIQNNPALIEDIRVANAKLRLEFEKLLKANSRPEYSQTIQELLVKFDKLINANQENIYLLYTRADLEVKMGNPHNALKYIERLDLLQQNKVDEQKCVLSSEIYAYVQILRGMAYSQIGSQDAKANDSFQRALNHAKSTGLKVYALSCLGQLASKVGLTEKAELYFSEILKTTPDNISALISLANLYGARDELNKTEEYLKQVLNIDPENIYASLGKAHWFTETAKVQVDSTASVKKQKIIAAMKVIVSKTGEAIQLLIDNIEEVIGYTPSFEFSVAGVRGRQGQPPGQVKNVIGTDELAERFLFVNSTGDTLKIMLEGFITENLPEIILQTEDKKTIVAWLKQDKENPDNWIAQFDEIKQGEYVLVFRYHEANKV